LFLDPARSSEDDQQAWICRGFGAMTRNPALVFRAFAQSEGNRAGCSDFRKGDNDSGERSFDGRFKKKGDFP
jgi:hypothetical protein